MSESRAVRFLRNASFNVFGQLLLVFLSFLIIPTLTSVLQPEKYALWGLLGTLAGYLALLTLGSGPATLKYVSEYSASGKSADLRKTIGYGLWGHLLLVSIGAIILLVFAPLLVDRVFSVPTALRPEALYAFRCAIAAAPFFAMTQFGASALQGLQRFDLYNIVSLAQSGTLLLGVYALVRLGVGIPGLGRFFLCVQISVGLAALILALKLLPARIEWRIWRRSDTAKRFVRFSLASFVGVLTWSVVLQFDRLFIGHWLSLSDLTYYMIPSFVLQKLFAIPTTISSVTFPMFSELHGLSDLKAMKIMYRKCFRLLLWAVIPIFVFLSVLAPQFLTLWLGEAFSGHGAWPLRILCLGYLIYFMAIIAGAAYSGAGYIRATLYANLALMGLCLMFWGLLVPRLGIVGAALGFCLAFIFAFIPFIGHVHWRLFSMSWRDCLKEICWEPCGTAAVLGFLLWSLRHVLFSWVGMILGGMISTTLYYLVGWYVLDAETRETLDHLVERALRARERRFLRTQNTDRN